MLQNIKTLIILLAIFFVAFFILKRLVKEILSAEIFITLQRAWYQITVAAFLSVHFWMFAFIATLCVHNLKKHIKNIPALFIFLLFAIPTAGVPIYGFAGINYFLVFDFSKLLSLMLLLPVAFSIYTKSNQNKKQSLLFIEKLFYLLILLKVILTFRIATTTVGIRSIFIIFTDVFLPFYVFSKLQSSRQRLKEVLIALLMAMTLLSFVGIVETVKHWSFYHALTESLGFVNANEFSISRDGMLRSVATSQQPIVLGFMVAVAFGLFFAVKNMYFNNSLIRKLTLLVLLLGLIAPFSRGPWMGAIIMLIVLGLLGKTPVVTMVKIMIGTTVLIGLMSVSESGKKILNMLPLIGNTESETFDYRSRLLESAFNVANRTPLFGSDNYLEQPEMEVMRQGQGIVDITNTYLQVLLDSGYVGLFLFSALILGTMAMLYKAIKLTNDNELSSIGKGLLSALVGVALMIADVSSISFVPWMYWILLAISASYIKLVKLESNA